MGFFFYTMHKGLQNDAKEMAAFRAIVDYDLQQGSGAEASEESEEENLFPGMGGGDSSIEYEDDETWY